MLLKIKSGNRSDNLCNSCVMAFSLNDRISSGLSGLVSVRVCRSAGARVTPVSLRAAVGGTTILSLGTSRSLCDAICCPGLSVVFEIPTPAAVTNPRTRPARSRFILRADFYGVSG